MILLCTLTRLCEGTPLQPLQPLQLNFLSHPCSTLLIYIFYRHDNITRVKSHRTPARSATQPAHHRNIAPLPTSQLYPAKVSAAPFRVAACHWRTFPLTSSSLTLSLSSSSSSLPRPPRRPLPLSHIDEIPPDVSSPHLLVVVSQFSPPPSPLIIIFVFVVGAVSSSSSYSAPASSRFFQRRKGSRRGGKANLCG